MATNGLLNRLAESVLHGFDGLIIGSEYEADGKLRGGINELLYFESSERSLDRIDTKAGSVLAHISMMIAAATFVVSSAETHWLEEVIIGLEITAYLFLALCCLRCLIFTDIPAKIDRLGGGKESIREKLRDRAVRHGIILNFAIRWTFFISFVFALSLFAHFAF